MTRTPFIGGNWKCNCTHQEAKSLARELSEAIKTAEKDLKSNPTRQIIIAPPSVYALEVGNVLLSSASQNFQVQVAFQNCSATGNGAFTGEISCDIIKSLDLGWVIVGHSERRKLFSENNSVVKKKFGRCRELGLNVILCIGETLEERENDLLKEVLSSQLSALKESCDSKTKTPLSESVVVAYEPVWAIGTGKVATPKEAQEAHLFIRNWISENISSSTADTIRVIYGGSVKPSNAAELFSENDIDGFLVGGASLNAKGFMEIVQAAR